MPLYFLAGLSPVLQLSLEIYKRHKFRKEIRYEQQLQQAVMSGVRNVYGQIIIFLGFLGFCGFFGIHVYLSERNQEIKSLIDPTNYNILGPLIMMIILSLLIFTPFIINPKLRFVVSIEFINNEFFLLQEILQEKSH